MLLYARRNLSFVVQNYVYKSQILSKFRGMQFDGKQEKLYILRCSEFELGFWL